MTAAGLRETGSKMFGALQRKIFKEQRLTKKKRDSEGDEDSRQEYWETRCTAKMADNGKGCIQCWGHYSKY